MESQIQFHVCAWVVSTYKFIYGKSEKPLLVLVIFFKITSPNKKTTTYHCNLKNCRPENLHNHVRFFLCPNMTLLSFLLQLTKHSIEDSKELIVPTYSTFKKHWINILYIFLPTARLFGLSTFYWHHCSHIPLVEDERKKFWAEEMQHKVEKYYQKVKTRRLYKIPLPHAF